MYKLVDFPNPRKLTEKRFVGQWSDNYTVEEMLNQIIHYDNTSTGTVTINPYPCSPGDPAKDDYVKLKYTPGKLLYTGIETIPDRIRISTARNIIARIKDNGDMNYVLIYYRVKKKKGDE